MADINYTGNSNDSVEIGLIFSDYRYTADSSNFYNNIKEKFEGMENDKLKELTNYAYYNSNSTPENTEKPDNLKVYESVNIENLKLNLLVNQLFHWKGRFDYADQMTYYLTNTNTVEPLFHLTLKDDQDIHVVPKIETTYMPIFLVKTDVPPENMEDGIYLVLPDNTNETIARCYNRVKITPQYNEIEVEQKNFDVSTTEYTNKKYIKIVDPTDYCINDFDISDDIYYLYTIDVSLYLNYLDGEGFPDVQQNNNKYNYIGFCIYKDNIRYDYNIVMDNNSTKIKNSWSNDIRKIYEVPVGTLESQLYQLQFYDYKNELIKSNITESITEIFLDDYTINRDDITKYDNNYIKIKRGYYYPVNVNDIGEFLTSYRSISGSYKFLFNAPNNILIDNSYDFPNINIQLIKWKEDEKITFNKNFLILFDRDIDDSFLLLNLGENSSIYEITTNSTPATLSNSENGETDNFDCKYNEIENSINTDTIKVKFYDLNTDEIPTVESFTDYTIKYKLKFIYIDEDNKQIDDNKITIGGNDLIWKSKSFTIKDSSNLRIQIYVEIKLSTDDKCLYISFISGNKTNIVSPESSETYTIQIENSTFTDSNGNTTNQFIFYGELNN